MNYAKRKKRNKRRKEIYKKYSHSCVFEGIGYLAEIKTAERNELRIQHTFIDATGGWQPHIEYHSFYFKKFKNEEEAMKRLNYLRNNNSKYEELLEEFHERISWYDENSLSKLKKEMSDYRKNLASATNTN